MYVLVKRTGELQKIFPAFYLFLIVCIYGPLSWTPVWLCYSTVVLYHKAQSFSVTIHVSQCSFVCFFTHWRHSDTMRSLFPVHSSNIVCFQFFVHMVMSLFLFASSTYFIFFNHIWPWDVHLLYIQKTLNTFIITLQFVILLLHLQCLLFMLGVLSLLICTLKPLILNFFF